MSGGYFRAGYFGPAYFGGYFGPVSAVAVIGVTLQDMHALVTAYEDNFAQASATLQDMHALVVAQVDNFARASVTLQDAVVVSSSVHPGGATVTVTLLDMSVAAAAFGVRPIKMRHVLHGVPDDGTNDCTITDFRVTAGDTLCFEIDVRDHAGNVIDISRVREISFSILTGQNTRLVKTITGGGIAAPTGGTDGVYLVNFEPSDTEGLSGWHSYKTGVTDFFGNVTTLVRGNVELGA